MTTCPTCDRTVPTDAPGGLCPRCLAGLTLASGGGEGGDLERLGAALGAALPKYEVEAPLGRGGMGVVFRARHRRLERPVALKVLAPELGDDPALVERFEREGRALARLDHPGIVRVFEVGEADGLLFLAMELVDGKNLRQLVDAGEVSSSDALRIVPQVCAALEYAHGQGIVHRDIKPENLLVDGEGRVKLADFGLARLVDAYAPAVSRLTMTGQRMGTLRYMSPEQLDDLDAEVDHRADVYSLGVVFYELLTGEVPQGAFEPPSRCGGVDPRLDAVVMRALHRDPARRYQGVADLERDVARLRRTQPPAARPPAPRARPVRWRRVVGWTALGLAIAVGAVAAVFSLRPSDWEIYDRLWTAAENGDVATVVEVFTEGAFLQPARSTDSRMPGTRTSALHVAVRNDHLELTRALVELAPNLLDEEDEHQRTPLAWAASLGREDHASELLRAGASPASDPTRTPTPLFLAAESGHVGVCELLIAAGADIEAGGEAGQTPLQEAAAEGQLDAVLRLLAHGADLRAVNELGNTAFFLAAARGQLEIAEELERRGANTGHIGEDGWTALHAAASNGFVEAVGYLLELDLALEARDHEGRTALFLAASEGHGEVLRRLLEAGAEATTRNDAGLFAVDQAARAGKPGLVGLLEAKGARPGPATRFITAWQQAADGQREEAARSLSEIEVGEDALPARFDFEHNGFQVEVLNGPLLAALIATECDRVLGDREAADARLDALLESWAGSDEALYRESKQSSSESGNTLHTVEHDAVYSVSRDNVRRWRRSPSDWLSIDGRGNRKETKHRANSTTSTSRGLGGRSGIFQGR